MPIEMGGIKEGECIVQFDLVDQKNGYWFSWDNNNIKKKLSEIKLYNNEVDYDVEIVLHSPDEIRAESSIADVEVVFNNQSLYNKDVFLSYHIYDSTGKAIQFENIRHIIFLDNAGRFSQKIPINIKGIINERECIIRFDLVDQKNKFWFLSNSRIRTNFAEIKYIHRDILTGIDAKLLYYWNIIFFMLSVIAIVIYRRINISCNRSK
jgi:hypothetical protein